MAAEVARNPDLWISADALPCLQGEKEFWTLFDRHMTTFAKREVLV